MYPAISVNIMAASWREEGMIENGTMLVYLSVYTVLFNIHFDSF